MKTNCLVLDGYTEMDNMMSIMDMKKQSDSYSENILEMLKSDH